MKNVLVLLSKFFSSMFGKKRPTESPCPFCGMVGHSEEDCPQAAKYKLFDVKRE